MLIETRATADAPAALLAGARALVEAAFVGHFDPTDWDHCLGGWHVFARTDHDVIAHAAAVDRPLTFGDRTLHAGYVEGVATAATHRHRGIGTRVMADLARVIHTEFEVGALSTGAHEFYERLGWERWQGPTFVRYGDNVVRTEDEDDGIMVLRFGPSAGLDLSLSITADSRRGDDW